jgi:hypothetical protein
LPNGLTAAGSKQALLRGVGVRSARGKKLKFATSVGHGTLTITLASAAAKAKLSIASPALKVSASLARHAQSQLRHKTVTALRFPVTIKDASGRATTLAMKLKPQS